MNHADAEGRWSELLAEARLLLDKNDLVRARSVLRAAMTYSDKTWGTDDVHLIRPLRLMAESLWREHGPVDRHNEPEIGCLQQALAIARRGVAANDLEIARLAGEVGHHLIVAGRLDEGCVLMMESLEIAERNASADFSHYLQTIAQVRMEQARPAEALPFIERAATLHERRDPSSVVHAITRYHLGKCLFALRRNQEAVNHLELALRIVDADGVDGKRRHAPLMSEIMDLIDRAKTETP